MVQNYLITKPKSLKKILEIYEKNKSRRINTHKFMGRTKNKTQ